MMRNTAAVPRSSRLVAALAQHRVVAVVRHHNADVAHEIAWACVAGGLGLIEITLTTPDATALISDLARRVPEGVGIGAGTVLDPAQVTTAAAEGAEFMVSPATDPDVLAAATAVRVPLVPGAATPTEVWRGVALGAPVVKIFPAGCLGLTFLRAVAAVMPHVPLLPSGGIAAADTRAWLDAGAIAVAIGSDLNAAHAEGGADAVLTLAARLAADAAGDGSTPHDSDHSTGDRSAGNDSAIHDSPQPRIPS